MSEAVRTALAAVVDGRTLSLDEARDAMGSVMDGEATPALLAALLVALRMRGESVDELAGFATAMRERVLRVDAPAADDGGDAHQAAGAAVVHHADAWHGLVSRRLRAIQRGVLAAEAVQRRPANPAQPLLRSLADERRIGAPPIA